MRRSPTRAVRRRGARREPQEPRDVLEGVGTAADQERHDQHIGQVDARETTSSGGSSSMNAASNLARHPPPPEGLGQLLGGRPAVRVPPGAVAHQDQRHLSPVEVLLAQQLGDPAGHERRQPRVGSHRRRAPEPHLGVAPVPRQRLRQHHFAVVARAGEERHHRDLVGAQLVEHAARIRARPGGTRWPPRRTAGGARSDSASRRTSALAAGSRREPCAARTRARPLTAPPRAEPGRSSAARARSPPCASHAVP